MTVGHNEDPFSLVGCADFSRAEYSPRRFVTKAFQVANDFSESKVDVSFDVFKETSNRSNCSDDFPDVRPEMSFVFFCSSFSSDTERGTWIAASDNVNSSSKRLHWQGFKICPNRCGIQLTRFHL